eukprot:5290473-Pleurochrysis_carterae.AAC.1
MSSVCHSSRHNTVCGRHSKGASTGKVQMDALGERRKQTQWDINAGDGSSDGQEARDARARAISGQA